MGFDIAGIVLPGGRAQGCPDAREPLAGGVLAKGELGGPDVAAGAYRVPQGGEGSLGLLAGPEASR